MIVTNVACRTLQLPTYANDALQTRKILTFLQKHSEGTKNCLQEWYNDFCIHGTVLDVDIFERDITTNKERITDDVKHRGKPCKKKQSNTTSQDSQYNKSEGLQEGDGNRSCLSPPKQLQYSAKNGQTGTGHQIRSKGERLAQLYSGCEPPNSTV